jgi:acyl-CoA synthetase (AMP-forming)/AMP-acid ligase II
VHGCSDLAAFVGKPLHDRQSLLGSQLADDIGHSARLAGGLHGLGLAAGGRAAILALNSDRYFEYLLAVPMAGGAVVPINIRLSAPEIQYILATRAGDTPPGALRRPP